MNGQVFSLYISTPTWLSARQLSGASLKAILTIHTFHILRNNRGPSSAGWLVAATGWSLYWCSSLSMSLIPAEICWFAECLRRYLTFSLPTSLTKTIRWLECCVAQVLDRLWWLGKQVTFPIAARKPAYGGCNRTSNRGWKWLQMLGSYV